MTSRSAVARRDERADGHGDAGDRHGLQPDFARAGQGSVKQPLTAEQLVFQAGYLLDIDGHARLKARDVSGVNHHFLPRSQIVFDQLAVNLNKGGAGTGQALHNEALTAEKACAQLFIEMDGKLNSRFRGEECVFLHDHFAAGGDIGRQDFAGEAGAESDHARAVRGIDVLEHAFAGKSFGKHFEA